MESFLESFLVAFAGVWLGLVVTTAPAFSAEPVVRLERVEITGVTIFSNETIENTLELGPGDLLDRNKVVQTEENIQSLYRIHGYEQVAIQSRLLKKAILEIRVEEGKPTRVAQIEFVPSGPKQESKMSNAGKDAWQRAKNELNVGVGIKANDIFDEEKITTAKRTIQDILAAQEYVGAKIDEVRATTVAGPIGAASTLSTDKWVRIQFFIRPGDRVTFGFRGNSIIPSTHLSSLVDEQRTLGLGQDFVAVIGARLEDEYRSMGYANAHVQAYTFENPASEERHVTYEIQEGKQVKIDSVDFDGNTLFSNQELVVKFYELAPPLVQRKYYVEKDVQKTADLVIEWMKSKGYLGAKLVTINRSFVDRRREDERNTRVKLIVYIYESEQTLVQSFKTNGVSVFSREEIGKFLDIKEGDPLNVFAFSEGIEKLKTAYRAKGYADVAVVNEGTDKVINYSDQNRLADVTLEVKEGPQYRVGKILIEGRNKTSEKVVLREIPLKEGDILEEPKIREAEANLRKLGIFSLVRTSNLEDPENPDKKILKVVLEEADPGVVAGGPGFRNDLGARLYGEIGYNNLWGQNHSVSLNAAVNHRVDSTFRFAEYQVQAAYSWPWFEGYEVTFRPTLTASGTEYINFDAAIVDFALNWEKRLLKNPNLIFIFTYDIERDHQFDAVIDPTQPSASDNGLFRIGSVTPTLKLDMRDNPLAPTRGLFTQTSLELARPFLGSQSSIGYDRLLFRADYTVPIATQVSWYFSFRSGWEKSTSADPNQPLGYGAIPLIKQFALGGSGSLRGYSDQELYYNSTAITGTLSYVDYRTQFDVPLSGGLRFGPFLDAANLRVDSFSFGALLYGAGFGFHYLTPVGPVNLDWGFKLNPIPGTETSQFYFSIGVL